MGDYEVAHASDTERSFPLGLAFGTHQSLQADKADRDRRRVCRR